VSYRPSTSPAGKATIKKKTTLTLNPLTVDADEGDSTVFTGKLSDSQGNGVPNKTIHFLIDGIDIGLSAPTDVNGDYTFTYVWATAGDYAYVAKYFGD